MSCINPKDVAEHIVMHEIIGIETGGVSPGLTIVNGYPVFEDPSRGNKQLSIARVNLYGTKKGRARDVYLFVGNGTNLRSTGWRLPRDATITTASVENSRSNTFTFKIRKNYDDSTDLYSLPVVASLGSHDKLVNVNVAEGDILTFFIDGQAHDPLAWIELAWRP